MGTIETKLLPSTNNRGYRVKATASGGASITIAQDHTLEECDKHAKAALALLRKLDWKGRMIGGHTKDGMVWVFADNLYQIVN